MLVLIMCVMIVMVILILTLIISFDWHSEEKLLNSFEQFTTEISGLQVHFIRALPKPKKGQVVFRYDNSQHAYDDDDHHHDHKVVLPLLLVHGWPGSIIEFLDIIPLLVEGNEKVVNIISS